MSNALFPALAGLGWNNTKAPKFNTIVQTSVSMAELRGSFASTPVYTFTLTFDLLRDNTTFNELKQLIGFFLARQGSYDSFLYADPSDSIATLQPFGTGDGSTTAFQLARQMGYFTEGLSNVALSPAIYVNGALQTSGYSVSGGLVTFGSAPGAGAALTWSGTYYFRCRFVNDTQEFEEFMLNLWDVKSLQFMGSLGTKI